MSRRGNKCDLCPGERRAMCAGGLSMSILPARQDLLPATGPQLGFTFFRTGRGRTFQVSPRRGTNASIHGGTCEAGQSVDGVSSSEKKKICLTLFAGTGGIYTATINLSLALFPQTPNAALKPRPFSPVRKRQTASEKTIEKSLLLPNIKRGRGLFMCPQEIQ